MRKKINTLAELTKLAKQYGVEKNALFVSAANQYAVQQKVIEQINEILSDGDMITTKEYVKGRENVYSHPLVKELPKHSDSANKTAATMLNIINTFGKENAGKSKLEMFIEER